MLSTKIQLRFIFRTSGLKSNDKMSFLRWSSNSVWTSTTKRRSSFSVGGEKRKGTLNEEEVKKFERMSSSWWDPDGAMKELHSMNRLRVPLIRDGLLEGQGQARLKKYLGTPKPLEHFEILDVGCGGGILTEPLGRLGASVIGLDPGQENISVAQLHLSLSHGLGGNVSYCCETIEQFVGNNPNTLFDGVVSSETIEHVDNPETFLKMIGLCVKPGGSLFLTTLNRTWESWAGAIVAWEYVFKKLPVGTHQWNKFLTPQEVQGMLNNNNFKIKLIHGMCYNPVNNQWSWSRSTSINYCIHAIKEEN